MELKYTASNISKAERALGTDFFSALSGLGEGTPSFTAILMLIMAGGMTEDEASNLIDEKGLEDAMGSVAEAIGRAGFLAKMKLMQSATKNRAGEPSPNTGKAKKA